ncbi:cystathionine beta-lyase family protein involved in aluminum resistance [Brevibacillus aydinogluensis]|jgi:cystathionine beta-lyase family protein involved in aluminum resistance|uniref:Methionine gamma-lyase family protein n=1 Tax=Brevibacillus aydinogluensis TaxID=927786 RepID=A0AA48RHF6_9BACL|nr:methionine gamma-lyase family protein [Brevibacillus aydinogluensis]MDT3417987.1 cystathionine beta-lyase family protein involved in aluminum resistance [Brevibacillus aydinogluensis]CAJ1002546.1 Methionine gamma-lyase family protein [Brevibacillus aydinogluensis]
MFSLFTHGERLRPIVQEVEAMIAGRHQEIAALVDYNQLKVLRSFQKHEVNEFHFAPSTGYGYDDTGRATLEAIYADVFGGEAALVRPHIISGTHAIAICLFGLLRPGDELLYITGKPYDTLEEVVGVRGEGQGSLKDYGIGYRYVPLTPEGEIDFAAVAEAITPNTKVIGIQRSRGYADRPSFTIAKLEEMIRFVKGRNPELIVFVDNCYGEFTEEREPLQVGADIMAGSLIKNPGGGLVKTGGYIVGRQDLVKLASYRMAAPGIGAEGGASLYSLLEMYQGFFLAPHVVGEALKGAIFSSALLERLGFRTNPLWHEPRTDLIQSVEFGSAERLIAFCQGIQKAAPVDSHVTPYPSDMPGYADPVIMAAGTFIQGASIEFSADGPIRPPYLGFVQGGLTYSHVKVGILTALDLLLEKGLLELPNT